MARPPHSPEKARTELAACRSTTNNRAAASFGRSSHPLRFCPLQRVGLCRSRQREPHPCVFARVGILTLASPSPPCHSKHPMDPLPGPLSRLDSKYEIQAPTTNTKNQNRHVQKRPRCAPRPLH